MMPLLLNCCLHGFFLSQLRSTNVATNQHKSVSGASSAAKLDIATGEPLDNIVASVEEALTSTASWCGCPEPGRLHEHVSVGWGLSPVITPPPGTVGAGSVETSGSWETCSLAGALDTKTVFASRGSTSDAACHTDTCLLLAAAQPLIDDILSAEIDQRWAELHEDVLQEASSVAVRYKG